MSIGKTEEREGVGFGSVTLVNGGLQPKPHQIWMYDTTQSLNGSIHNSGVKSNPTFQLRHRLLIS